MVKLVKTGQCPRNRPGYSTQKSRRAKKLAGNTTWFKKQLERAEPGQKPENSFNRNRTQPKPKLTKKNRNIEATMNILHTPGGKLKSMLSKMEDGLNFISKERSTRAGGPSASRSPPARRWWWRWWPFSWAALALTC